MEPINNSLPSMNDGGNRVSYGNGKAIREPTTGKGRFDLISPFGIMRLAKWYEAGAMKYADRNWEKGMPLSRYIDSALRHINKYIMGMQDEDHLAAAAWNILAIIHHEELGQTDLDDMPHYLSKQEEKDKGSWCHMLGYADGKNVCLAHLAEGRILDCPYNVKDFNQGTVFCPDYKSNQNTEKKEK